MVQKSIKLLTNNKLIFLDKQKLRLEIEPVIIPVKDVKGRKQFAITAICSEPTYAWKWYV